MHEYWEELLPFYVNGTLPEGERARLEAHLAECDTCHAALIDWQHIASTAHDRAQHDPVTLPPLPPLPSLNSRHRRFALTTNKEDSEMNADVMVRPVPNLRPLALAMTALLIIFGGYLALNLLPDGGPQSTTLEVLRSAEEVNTDAFNLYIDQVWNAGDLDKLDAILTVDHVRHDPLTAEDITGIAGVRAIITSYQAAFPDVQVTVDDIIAEEDRVWAQLTFTGTHSQPLELDDGTIIPASNEAVTWTATKISRYEVGKMAELWLQADTLDLMQQIGAMPLLQEQAVEEQNKEVVRGAIDMLWGNTEPTLLEVLEYYTANLTLHGPSGDWSGTIGALFR